MMRFPHENQQSLMYGSLRLHQSVRHKSTKSHVCPKSECLHLFHEDHLHHVVA